VPIKPVLVRYVLTGAIRDKLLLSLGLVLVLGACLALFLGSSTIIEQDQFTIVFASGGLRIACLLGLILFVVFFVRRSFDSRDIEFLLSRPISRTQFVLSYAFSFALIALFLALAEGFMIFAIGPHLFSSGHLLWVFSIVIEYIVMANVALFFAMVLSSASSGAMACLGFYTLARMMGQILGISDSTQGDIFVFKILEYAVQGISIVVPRLDLFGQTSWLIYGSETSTVSYGFVALQGLFFSVLVIVACLLDLSRRKF
jgi:hypothetical protein